MLEDYEPLLRGVAAERPIWEALREGVAGLPLAGLWPVDNRLLMANRKVDNTGWFWEGGVYDIQRPNPLADLELRIREHRVFYDVDEHAARVRIVAVGYKEHNKLFIGGEKFEL